MAWVIGTDHDAPSPEVVMNSDDEAEIDRLYKEYADVRLKEGRVDLALKTERGMMGGQMF